MYQVMELSAKHTAQQESILESLNATISNDTKSTIQRTLDKLRSNLGSTHHSAPCSLNNSISSLVKLSMVEQEEANLDDSHTPSTRGTKEQRAGHSTTKDLFSAQ